MCLEGHQVAPKRGSSGDEAEAGDGGEVVEELVPGGAGVEGLPDRAGAGAVDDLILGGVERVGVDVAVDPVGDALERSGRVQPSAVERAGPAAWPLRCAQD